MKMKIQERGMEDVGNTLACRTDVIFFAYFRQTEVKGRRVRVAREWESEKK